MKTAGFPENPLLILVYFLIALVLVLNIFVSGYWYGRTQEISKNVLPARVAAQSAPMR